MVTPMGPDDKVLVTAFGAFTTRAGLRIDPNPTVAIAEAIGRRCSNVVTATLPVSFERTPAALEGLIERWKPAAWLGMGAAATRPDIDIEVIALNVEHASRADNDGDSPTDRPIVPLAPAAYRTRLDAAALAAELRADGLPVSASHHAGTFLCNQAFFVGCHRSESRGVPAVAAFVHVPVNGVEQSVIVDAVIRVINRLT